MECYNVFIYREKFSGVNFPFYIISDNKIDNINITLYKIIETY